MEKQIIQSLLAVSVSLLAAAIGLAAFARPAANWIITVAGRGSAALALMAMIMFVVFKIAEKKQLR